MPAIHHYIMSKLLPGIQPLASDSVSSVAHVRFAVPLVPQRLQTLQLAPVHVASLFCPREPLRVKNHTKRLFASGIPTDIAVQRTITRLRRLASGA